jgi:hypothetical protein
MSVHHTNNTQKIKDRQSSPVSHSEQQLLGNTTGFASTPENTSLQTPHDKLKKSVSYKIENNENRYALQKIAKKYHPNSRLSACMCSISPGKDHVEVHYHEENRHAHYQNIMRCDNVWLCPVCSGRITSRRAEEIRQAYGYAVDVLNYRVVMVTYTLQHSRFDSLQKNLDDIRDARRKMRSGRKWQKFKADYGYSGAISSLEVTWGLKNGWHTHVHEIMFFDDKKADYELSVKDRVLDNWLNDSLSQWWIDSLAKVNRSASLQNGIDVTSTDQYIAEYVAKFGKLPASETWDIALELSKSMSKQDSDGMHPFTILERSNNPVVPVEDRKRYLAVWYEYADAFHGRKQMYWTPGLKELLLVDVIEEPGDIEEPGKIVLCLSRDAWKAIVYLNKQADVLNETIICKGKIENIERYVRNIIADANLMQRSSHERTTKPTIYQ